MLSEPLSLRDYFAGQALIGQMSFKRSGIGSETAWAAYKMADAMLARREKDGRLRDHEIEGLTRRAETAERSLEIFQASVDYIPRVALTQFWELLGATNQTEAMETLRIWKERAGDRA
jgi:hypothetical protein